MTFIKSLLQSSRFHSFMILLIVSSLAWNLGPLLVINGSTPLAEPLNRAPLLFVLFAFWAFGTFLTDQDSGQTNLPSHLNNAFKSLSADLKQALKISTSSKKNWFLVLGHEGSGKSTLLNTIKCKRQPSDSPLCDYWHSDKATYVDVSSENFDMSNAHDNIHMLKNLFNKMKSHHITPAGIIITTNLMSNVHEQQNSDRQSNLIRTLIEHLNTIYPEIAISIVATKADLLSGFNEFFDDLGPEERTDSCGIQFPAPPHDASLPDLCDQEFSALLTRMNDRLLSRLHQEPDLRKRYLIKDFPIQIEMLKPNLGHLLNQILPNVDVTLNGIYFTSCAQSNTPVESGPHHTMEDVDEFETISNLPTTMQQKTFFVTQLFEDLANAKLEVKYQDKNAWVSYGAAAAAIIVITFGSQVYQNTQKKILSVTAVNQLLEKASHTPNTEPYKNTIAKLYAMQQAFNTLKVNKSELSGNSEKQNTSLMKQSQLTFWIILQQQFFSELTNTVTDKLAHLTASNSHDYVSLFRTLSTYLMLHDPSHLNKQHVVSWFNQQWDQSKLSRPDKKMLNKYLKLLLSQSLPQQKINFGLMLRAQEMLQEKTPAKIAMILIHQNLNSQPVKLVNYRADNIIDPKFNTVPSIYTQVQFDDIMNTRIVQASHFIANYIWTIDDEKKVNFQSIASEAQADYLNAYAHTWQQVIQHVHYAPQKDFNGFLVTLNSLTTSHSPVAQLLQEISKNTSPLRNEPEFNSIVSAQFNAFHHVNLNRFSRKASNMARLMNAIGNAKNPISTSYAHARLRLSHHMKKDSISSMFAVSDQLPEPFKQWSHNLTRDGWHLILSGARKYLNAVWQQFVLPEYNHTIKNRFPVYNQAKTDIKIEDFSRFFAVNGVLDTYYKNYLKDFVDESHGWKWREVDGQNIGIPVATLENFLRAMLIQKMLFANNEHQPNVTFNLKQTALNPAVKAFSLKIDGQAIEYTSNSDNTTMVNWPNTERSDNEMQFTSIDGKANKLDFHDVWGWYRLLNLAQINTTDTPSTIEVVFKFAGQTIAQYKMMTENAINPFTPDIINSFRCIGVL